MDMTTEWTFIKNGRKTEAQRTRISSTDEEPSEEDRKKLVELAGHLIKIAKRLKAEEMAAFKETEEEGI